MGLAEIPSVAPPEPPEAMRVPASSSEGMAMGLTLPAVARAAPSLLGWHGGCRAPVGSFSEAVGSWLSPFPSRALGVLQPSATESEKKLGQEEGEGVKLQWGPTLIFPHSRARPSTRYSFNKHSLSTSYVPMSDQR